MKLSLLSLTVLFLLIMVSCGKEDPEIKKATNGQVVINELMASNTTIVADQDGEYDDWIELYNLSSETVDLSGFFMSDNGNNPTRWRIPNGTTIAGNGYLIIWADAQLTQTGLHADFKLTGTGEELLLLNSDVELVDQVTFGEQIGEVSYARKPNGTGAFAWGTPTYNGSND